MADWKHVITDLDGSNAVELLGARQRKLTKPLNNMATLEYMLDVDHRLADRIVYGVRDPANLVYPLRAASDGVLCKAYRRPLGQTSWGLPVFIGEVIGAEENGDEQDPGSVKVTHADPLFRLFRRLVGNTWDSAGKGIGFGAGTAGGQVDKSAVFTVMLAYVNSVAPTGVAAGNMPASGSTTYLGPWYFKKVAEAMIELANTLGGPDFNLRYQEPTGAWPYTTLCSLDTATPLGAIRPEAIFEYGRGKRNAKNYKIAIDRNAMCNVAWSLPSGYPDAAPAGEYPVYGYDTLSETLAGRYEDVVPGDLTGLLRHQIADMHAAIRGKRRQQMTFTIVPDAQPDYGVAYTVGDVVTGRAQVRNSMRFDGLVRCYGATFSLDEQGVESIDLTLIPQA